MLLREKFWLWGHPEGCYNNMYGNTGISRMTPMEACLYLGITNTFMVPDGEHKNVQVNRRQYNKSFKTLQHVGWEFGNAFVNSDGNTDIVDQYLEEVKEFPNISCAVFDDFKCVNGEKISIEESRKFHERFRNNDIKRLDTWMVFYTHEFGKDSEGNKIEYEDVVKPYLELFDGIIMWTWKESDVPLIPEKFKRLKELAPNQRYMFGCYLWNFGECKEATREAVKWQLDWYRERIIAGEAEGVVFHTNTMADLDYDAYVAAVEWMEEHGDEVFPD